MAVSPGIGREAGAGRPLRVLVAGCWYSRADSAPREARPAVGRRSGGRTHGRERVWLEWEDGAMSLMGDLFGTSPIRPMQQHMRASVACAREILPLFEAMAAGKTQELAARRETIDRLEHEADRIKNEIRSRLPKRLMLAVERRDMLEILDYQDCIADRAQDIAELVEIRSMTIPETLADPMLDLIRRVIAACEAAERIIDELDELVETGFRGREVARVEEMIDELSRIETDTDELAEGAQRKLFALEAELGISVVFWNQIIGWAANLADNAEKVGNRLRLLIAK